MKHHKFHGLYNVCLDRKIRLMNWQLRIPVMADLDYGLLSKQIGSSENLLNYSENYRTSHLRTNVSNDYSKQELERFGKTDQQHFYKSEDFGLEGAGCRRYPRVSPTDSQRLLDTTHDFSSKRNDDTCFDLGKPQEMISVRRGTSSIIIQKTNQSRMDLQPHISGRIPAISFFKNRGRQSTLVTLGTYFSEAIKSSLFLWSILWEICCKISRLNRCCSKSRWPFQTPFRHTSWATMLSLLLALSVVHGKYSHSSCHFILCIASVISVITS